MLEFLLIILIFLEITGLYFAVGKIIKLNKKIQECNKKLLDLGEEIKKVHIQIQTTIRKINFFVSILTNKKFLTIRKIISLTISLIEFLIILKSFNFKKGVKFNLKNVKKLLIAKLTRKIAKKVFNSLTFLCA